MNAGECHVCTDNAGEFVRHRYLAKKDPNKPNLRQVLIVDMSILATIEARGIQVAAGMLGENILVDVLAVMALPVGAKIEIGGALLEVTEVRNPCLQLNEIDSRLLKVLAYRSEGKVHRNAGMMARVLTGGTIKLGDAVSVQK